MRRHSILTVVLFGISAVMCTRCNNPTPTTKIQYESELDSLAEIETNNIKEAKIKMKKKQFSFSMKGINKNMILGQKCGELFNVNQRKTDDSLFVNFSLINCGGAFYAADIETKNDTLYLSYHDIAETGHSLLFEGYYQFAILHIHPWKVITIQQTENKSSNQVKHVLILE